QYHHDSLPFFSRQGKRLPPLQNDLHVAEAGNAYLWALQIAHDRNVASEASGDLAQHLYALPVLVRGAMGKIQPSNVQAGKQQLFDAFWAGAGGTERGDDLGASSHGSSRPSC